MSHNTQAKPTVEKRIGFVKTIEIDVPGEILDMVIDTLEFDTTNCEYPNIIHVSGNIYALAYQGKGNDGFLKTVEITPSGQINNTVIDTLEFDPVVATTPNIIPVSGNIFAMLIGVNTVMVSLRQ